MESQTVKTIAIEELISKARSATGLSDLGDPAAIDGLTRLVKASNEEARLSMAGLQRWEANLVGILSNRLRIIDHLKRNPELLQRPVKSPLFVFGLPRTGTTLVINLLSADPARRCLLRWEALNSVPPAEAGALHSDVRCIAEQKRLDMAVKHAPQIAAAHYESADSPSECQFAMALSFCSQIFESNLYIPSYLDWFQNAASYLPALRFHKQLLQLLQANNGGRWTLKNPWHPLFLDDLRAVYPDAQLAMTHRDPVEVLGSACSLIRLVRPMFSEVVDLEQIARQLVATFDLMIARQDEYRRRHGEEAIYDIQYTRLVADPVGQMRALYAHFGEPLTTDAETAMSKLLHEQPQGKHGRHEYSLEEFGLTADGVRARFRDYSERFGIVAARRPG